jgi:hypothetical protein
MKNEPDSSTVPTVDHKPHAAFFRQSGWMMIATIAGGAMTFGVHFLNKKIPNAEYSIFGTLLMVTACIPAMPLQMVFAQQTAQSLATSRERQLAGMIRLAWFWSIVLWIIGAFAVLMFQDTIVRRWELGNPVGLWVTLAVLLASVWLPMFAGVLQGRQDFFWFGWAMILGGVARLIVAAIAVFFIAANATSLMMGTLAGIGLSAAIIMWRCRDLAALKPEKFDIKGSLGQIVPLMLGFGACQFLFTTDTMYAKAYFTGEEMKPYVAAGTLSRALLWLVLPLAAVMFPKIVHSSAKSEKTNLFNIVVLGTAVLAICGALGLWLVGPFVVRLVYRSGDVAKTVALLPWYAGAMIPLALGNVIVNDLLARGRFKIVPFLVVLVLVYAFALPVILNRYPARLEVVLQTLAIFNSLLFAISAWFIWVKKDAAPQQSSERAV